MTTEEKRMAEMEAAIESKDSRTRAMLKEKEDKILRVSDWSVFCTLQLHCVWLSVSKANKLLRDH